MATQPQGDVAVLADSPVVEVDLDQGRCGNSLAIAHSEVERRADDHYDIGTLEGIRAGPVEATRIIGAHHPPCRTVHVGRDVERPCEFDRFPV